jgi:hypothetical protein
MELAMDRRDDCDDFVCYGGFRMAWQKKADRGAATFRKANEAKQKLARTHHHVPFVRDNASDGFPCAPKSIHENWNWQGAFIRLFHHPRFAVIKRFVNVDVRHAGARLLHDALCGNALAFV